MGFLNCDSKLFCFVKKNENKRKFEIVPTVSFVVYFLLWVIIGPMCIPLFILLRQYVRIKSVWSSCHLIYHSLLIKSAYSYML